MKNQHKARHAGLARLLAAVLTVILTLTVPAITAFALTEAQRPQVKVEVVEEIPAELLDEQETPLSAAPVNHKSCAMHALLSLAVLAFTIYCIRCCKAYDEKLFRLRLEAAHAEEEHRRGARQ